MPGMNGGGQQPVAVQRVDDEEGMVVQRRFSLFLSSFSTEALDGDLMEAEDDAEPSLDYLNQIQQMKEDDHTTLCVRRVASWPPLLCARCQRLFAD